MKLQDVLQLSETVNTITLFHGTPVSVLPMIYKSGYLLAQKPKHDGNVKGVYFTHDFELAARYGMNSSLDISNPNMNVPAVLEVVITQNKRIKSMVYDPLDRHASAWDEDGNGDYGNDDLRRLNSNITSILEKAGLVKNTYYRTVHIPELDHAESNEPDVLDGVNIVKAFFAHVKEVYPQITIDQARKVRDLSKTMLANTNYEMFDVMEDGTIKMNDDWYHSREQLIYPDKNIPTQAIKAIWIRQSDFAEVAHLHHDGSPAKHAGFKMLPMEAKRHLEQAVAVLDKYSYDINFDRLDKSDVEEDVETLKGLGYDDLAGELETHLLSIPEEEWGTAEVNTDSFAEAAGFLQGEEWGEDKVLHGTDWLRIPQEKIPGFVAMVAGSGHQG